MNYNISNVPCTCGFPLTRHTTSTSHAEKCPTHILRVKIAQENKKKNEEVPGVKFAGQKVLPKIGRIMIR